MDAAQNAFSTRRIRPGRLSFRFPPGHDLQSLVGRLAEHGWWGEIVGPHGSGKSTLLEGLLPLCASAGRQMERFQLRSDQPRLEITADQRRRWSERTLVVVDGYEQLSYFARWRLKRWCRRRSAGLLVTSHQTVGLPLLLHTKTSSGLLRDLVSELVAEAPEAWRPNDVEIDEVFVRSGGNLREALLSLYDVYQRRQRGSSPSSP